MAATDILTAAEAYAALNIVSAAEQSANAVEVAQVVSAASTFADNVYGPVVQRTVTGERHDGGGARLFLRHRPVVSVTSVTEYSNGVATVLTAESATVAGTFRADLSTGELFRRTQWYASRFASQEVVVTYVAGRFATTAAVEAIFKEACVAALVHFWQHRGSQSGFGTVGGDGAPFGGVPFSTAVLRKKLVEMAPLEWIGPAVA